MVQELIKALRSGKYKQTRGQLRNGDCFCVLGLACEISNLGTWDFTDERLPQYVTKSFKSGLEPPPEVMEYFGFNNFNSNSLGFDSLSDDLADLNDKSNESFNQIADRLEELCLTKEI